MKSFTGFLTTIALCFAFASCQKELDFENLGGPSNGTLKKDSTNCLPSSVNGLYVEDSSLNSDHYIDVQVDVRFLGTYVIYSDTVNGFSFRDEGDFNTVGLQTVRLFGSGRPQTAGNTPFIIRYDTSACIVNVDVDPSGANATYTFGGAGGTCTSSTLAGIYMEGLATTASNTVTVGVQITTLGNYSISTTQVNGVTFSGSGTFNNLSQTTVVLTATGTPAAAGNFTFALLGSGSSCSFPVNFDAAAGQADYTFGGAGGSCTGATLSGNYDAGVPMSNNTATLNVTVTTPGTYSISTSVINGITFSASGVFTTATSQPVTLIASGTPNSGGSFDYFVTGGTTNCSFTVVFTAATTDLITADVDGVATTFNFDILASLDNISSPAELIISGFTTVTGSEAIDLLVQRSDASPIVAGTYTVNQPAASFFVSGSYTTAAGTEFSAFTNGTAQSPEFIITINSITAAPSSRITGTFSGPVKDNGGAGPGIRNITNGIFDVALQ